jgi:hypothetical protein
MNPLQQRFRTLGELLTELKARLGFVAQGPASNNNNAVLMSFLQEGHDYVFQELAPTPTRKSTTIRLEPGSVLYDWHNDLEDEDIDPGTAQGLWLVLDAQNRIPLIQGITQAERAFPQRRYPTKYDTTNGQIEVWPVPDQGYDLIIDYLAPKPRFTQAADRPGVPDRLILLYAIANAKAHYRHPDAQAAGATFANMLRTEKGRQHENRRYLVNACETADETVIGADGQYRFRVR